MTYTCSQCNMGVTNMECSSCHKTLIHDTIHADGNDIGVSKCPDNCGMIKSPQCCGHDMNYQAD